MSHSFISGYLNKNFQRKTLATWHLLDVAAKNATKHYAGVPSLY